MKDILEDFIPPLRSNENGWPWMMPIEARPSEKRVNKNCWPQITIVTPSYNQVDYIEETIRSVLLQGYPNLEYIVMDGGSSDGSREIIEYYAPYLTYWRSEKDEGQSAAIKDGFEQANGIILGWLNSDDLLLPGALFEIGHYFAKHPEVECVVGGSIVIDGTGDLVHDRMGLPRILRGGSRSFKHLLLVDCGFFQPASFWRRDVYSEVGGLDPNFVFTMDYDLYLRFAKRRPLTHIDKILACFRFHPNSKTSQLDDVRLKESQRLWRRYKLDEISTTYRFFYKISKFFSVRIHNLPIRIGVKLGIIQLEY